MDRKKLLMMVEIAIFAAIGLVLDQVSFKMWAQGGSISFVMVPIMLMAIRWGLTAGLTTGLLIGVMQMMFGAYIVHWLQAILDYGLAFTVVGLAAIVRKPLLEATQSLNKVKMALYIVIGALIGGALRFVSHLLAVSYSLKNTRAMIMYGPTQLFTTVLIWYLLLYLRQSSQLFYSHLLLVCFKK